MTNPVLYAVRHGETQLNKKGHFRGNKDIPLNSLGVKQAEAAGKELIGKNPTVIVSSDLKRATVTAGKIAKQQKNKPHLIKTSMLRPLNVGKFSGKPKTKENLNLLNEYINNPKKIIPEGESLANFRKRVHPILNYLISLARKGHVPILVAHASIIHELGNMVNKDHKSALVKPGGIVTVSEKNSKLHAEAILHKDGKDMSS